MNNIFFAIFVISALSACNQQQNSSSHEIDRSLTVSQDVVQATLENQSVELVEIKLIDAQYDERGYCVDLFDHLTMAQPLAGLQGHNCFLYFGEGPTVDQGFDLTLFNNTGQLKLDHFDVCMEVHNPAPGPSGSFVATELCTGSSVQTFEMSDSGEIKPLANSDICLTIGDLTVPGGPRVVPPGLNLVFPPENNLSMHTIRRLTFEACSSDIATRQQWEFRSGDYVPDEAAVTNRFN